MKKKTLRTIKTEAKKALKLSAAAFLVAAFLWGFYVGQGIIGEMNYVNGFKTCMKAKTTLKS